jgi:transposase
VVAARPAPRPANAGAAPHAHRKDTLYWDRSGFAMWTKRLERGRFHPQLSSDGRLSASAIEAADLALLFEGIDLAGAHRRPRWEPVRAA